MFTPEPRRAASYRAVDGNNLDARRVEELVDIGVGSQLQWTHDRLCVGGRAEEKLIASRQSRAQLGDRAGMLIVPRIEERDHDVRVERYARHSSRNWSK